MKSMEETMKGILHLFKIFVELGVILLLILILVVSINFLRGTNQSSMISAGAEIYPSPQNEIEQTQNTPNVQTSPYPASEAQSMTPAIPQKKRFIGPDCLIDYSKKLSLQLLSGWYGDINASSINIVNYDPDSIGYEHGKPKNIPANSIKIEIYKLKFEPNQTLEQWVSTEKAQSKGQDGNSLTVSENSPYKLGKYDGISYALTDLNGWNSRIIALKVNTDEGIVVNIFPANSQAFSDGLAILSTLDASENFTCSEISYSPNQATELPDDLNHIKNETLTTFECPTEVTYPGSEAKSSTIDLQMPFLWGQTWIVGGDGAFYGNYHHCNYYNNYYATDWNRPDNNDAGFFVVSIAAGTVSSVDTPPCTTERYGCFVDVDHSSGFRTRYAHLDSVFVSPGATVGAGAALGTVGESGTDNSHLHLSFWHWDLSDYPYHYDYFCQCYYNGQTCPNGEAPYYPQGYRPSPMWTTYGNAFLADGLPFTSTNGRALFLPFIINSSQ
jgi:murein DD-endopeptidase MepM/ murein hydrolase activator NlpD